MIERRDYIERLIEQAAAAIAAMLGLRQAGRLDAALQVVREAEGRLMGPHGAMLERLEAGSAVSVVGPDLVRAYAALVGEEGVLHGARGDSASAFLCCRRSLELYAALSLAGIRLEPAERERVAVLHRSIDIDQLAAAYRDEIRRLA
jgi:hypothetical protein